MTVDQNVINQGMFGFMNYIIGGSQFTATQKKNAQEAASMLTGAADKPNGMTSTSIRTCLATPIRFPWSRCATP